MLRIKKNLIAKLFMGIFFVLIFPLNVFSKTSVITCFGDSLTAGYGLEIKESYPSLLQEKLKKEGYMNLAISGSRQEEVELFAKHHGFDDWIGQTWHRSSDGARFTGEVTSTYKDKHLILESLVKKHNLTYEGSYGLGDTGNDVSMLETVETPIAINPNHSLLDEAKKRGWKIVVERKSIAYTLEPRDGSYILV